MKNVYTLLVALLMSVVAFGQSLTFDTKTIGTDGFQWAQGTYAAGSKIVMAGTGYAAGDKVTATLTNWTSWETAGTTIYGTVTAIADAKGSFSVELVIDAATPAGEGLKAGVGYMIHAKRSDNSIFAHNKNFANVVLSITNDNANPAPTAGLSVSFGGKDLLAETVDLGSFGNVTLGETFAVTGTCDLTKTVGGVTYNYNYAYVNIYKADASITDLVKGPEGTNTGDVYENFMGVNGTTGAFTHTYKIQSTLPLSSTLTDGDLYLARVTIGYKNADGTNTWQYESKRIGVTVVDVATSTSVLTAGDVKVVSVPNGISVEAPEGATYEVYNLSGVKVSTNNLSTGIYIVVVSLDGETIVKKVVVE